MPPPQSARNTFLPSYSNVNCWMKCGGMVSPLASLTKPESIGCWISACTSVMSPLAVARTRMLDAIVSLLAAAAADGDLHFLGRAVELAVGFHDRGHIGGLGHLHAVRHRRNGAVQNPVARDKRVRVLGDEERDRGDLVERRRYRDRHHAAILGDFGRVELDLVGWFGGLAV